LHYASVVAGFQKHVFEYGMYENGTIENEDKLKREK
jgi:hypothetical protein